jgi:hypothetical protein
MHRARAAGCGILIAHVKTVRIGTWNVDHARPLRNDGRLEILRTFGADVWVLTETRDDLSPGDEFHPVHSAPRSVAHPGERWVSIWSSLPFIELVPVHDKSRTVAALYETSFGPLVVFATVLPWHADTGPNANARNWTEQHRIVPEQADEWAAIRQRYPTAALCVAGDLNMNLGGPHYYGTKVGRELLEQGLEDAGLECVTRTEHVPEGRLQLPHIDHVCLSTTWAPGARVVEAWPGTIEGVELSDHSGLVVSVEQPVG